ncbi:MAG: ATP-grasp domain-containing protein [Sporichthyaceae bacterium]|nr:ATP-grasp domain-containing protein [Sporichthyaceae bacterium]
MTPTERPLLLLITTGGRPYREYLLRSILTGYRVHLLLGAEPSWECEYLHGWTVLSDLTSTTDVEEMVAAAREVNQREPLQGVLSWDEARILQSAKVAAEFGLPGGDPDMIMRCRDKHLTRQTLAAAGVPQPRSVLTSSLDDALAAAAEIGYPVVLKPRALAASLGVVRADSPDDVVARFGFAHDTTFTGAWQYDLPVLVEEYLTGPEISLDAAVYHGQVLPMFVARKHIGYPPYFEEIGHVVDAADPLLTDPQLLRIVQDTHTALGFTDGMTHTELKLTLSGPKVIEVNSRLGGDLIPYLGLRATGIDPGLAAAAVACGQPPAVVADRKLVGAVRFFYVDQERTTIDTVEFDHTTLPPEVDRAEPLVKAGDVVSPPPAGTLFGRIAIATAVTETAEQAQAALDAAEAALTVRAVDPAPVDVQGLSPGS